MDTQNTPNESKANKPSGYNVENVILLESSFSRINNIEAKGAQLSHEINLVPTPHETRTDNKFSVTLTLNYVGKFNETSVCSATIKMVGGFEKYGEPLLTDDKFKAINAPAIIYPFVREHLHSLCQKAGMADVLLPTVNFKP
jgi:preprotein translocase subunit SecB